MTGNKREITSHIHVWTTTKKSIAEEVKYLKFGEAVGDQRGIAVEPV